MTQPPSIPCTQHLEGEDRRVKRLTELVLYDFLPAALQVMLPQVRIGVNRFGSSSFLGQQ